MAFIKGEARQALKTAQQDNPAFKPGDEFPTTVVLRVDEGCEYGFLDRIIRTCQDNGFRRFSFNSSVGLEARKR